MFYTIDNSTKQTIKNSEQRCTPKMPKIDNTYHRRTVVARERSTQFFQPSDMVHILLAGTFSLSPPSVLSTSVGRRITSNDDLHLPECRYVGASASSVGTPRRSSCIWLRCAEWDCTRSRQAPDFPGTWRPYVPSCWVPASVSRQVHVTTPPEGTQPSHAR